jgi:hypothetical protein
VLVSGADGAGLRGAIMMGHLQLPRDLGYDLSGPSRQLLWKFLMAQDPPFNLNFINQDVSAQLERSRQIIEVADRLRQVLPQIKDDGAKKQVEEQIKTLLTAAQGLTANATATSTSATTLSISIGSSSRHP